MINKFSNLVYALGMSFVGIKSSKQLRNKGLLKAIAWSFKIGVSGAAILYIFSRLNSSDSTLTFNWISELFRPNAASFFFLAATMILVSLNLGIEIYKWHILIKDSFQTHWRTAIKGVLSGTTFGIFTPNRMGEFVGRILALHSENRLEAIVLSLVNSVSQTMATFTFGIIGFLFLIESIGLEQFGFVPSRVLQLMLILFWLLSLFYFFRIKNIAMILDKSERLRRFSKFFHVLIDLDSSKLSQLFNLSLLRFVTFIGQYILVFNLFYTQPNWVEISALAMLTLFSSTLFSFIPVPDIVMREAMAVSYFALFHFDLAIITQAVFLVWLINVAFPALAGAFILLTYRIFRSV